MNKKILGIILISLVIVGGLGVAAYFTKGFTNFKTTDSETGDSESPVLRINYRSFDFSSDQNGSLTKNTVINFVNNHNRENKNIFSAVAIGNLPAETTPTDLISYVFADKELGIRLGTQSNEGYCVLDCVQNFSFDHIRVEAVNYNRKAEGGTTYEKEINGSTLGINGMAIDLKASSTSQPDTKVVKEISFTEKQTQLQLIGSKGRPCILKLELWSE